MAVYPVNGHMPSLMTFDHVPTSVRLQLAVHLEVENSPANWQMLAEELHCPPPMANFIKERQPAAPHRSCTMLFFEEWCQQRRIVDVISALRMIENVPCVQILEVFLAPKHVFITCTIDDTQHFNNIVRLCEKLKRRRFKVGVDQNDASLERTNLRFNKADYVLILISALYYRTVTEMSPVSTPGPPAGSKYTCNARYVFRDLVLPAVCQSADGDSGVKGTTPAQPRPQFVVALMPGAKSQHVPSELHEAGIPMFHLPEQESELLKYLS